LVVADAAQCGLRHFVVLPSLGSTDLVDAEANTEDTGISVQCVEPDGSCAKRYICQRNMSTIQNPSSGISVQAAGSVCRPPALQAREPREQYLPERYSRQSTLGATIRDKGKQVRDLDLE
jgi:hypothetical protein